LLDLEQTKIIKNGSEVKKNGSEVKKNYSEAKKNGSKVKKNDSEIQLTFGRSLPHPSCRLEEIPSNICQKKH
jgi:hypothetical protein